MGKIVGQFPVRMLDDGRFDKKGGVLRTMLVLCAILDDQESKQITIKELTTTTRCGSRQIHRDVAALVEWGYVKLEPTFGPNQERQGNQYSIIFVGG
jgi:hypothetical protein